MKNCLLITILLLSLVIMPCFVFAQDEGYGPEHEWHEDCIWECISKGNTADACLAKCEEIADTGDPGTGE